MDRDLPHVSTLLLVSQPRPTLAVAKQQYEHRDKQTTTTVDQGPRTGSGSLPGTSRTPAPDYSAPARQTVTASDGNARITSECLVGTPF